MHVLIIPSEEYVPEHAPMAGIFQRHQIEALQRTGGVEKIGVLSVRLQHSLPMYLKTLAFRLIGKRVDNGLATFGMGELLKRILLRLRNSSQMISYEDQNGVNIVRVEGIYLSPPDPRWDPRWWCRSGHAAYDAYASAHGRPDLIHAHNAVSAGLLADRIRARYGVPYVLSEHSSYYQQNNFPEALFPGIRRAIANCTAFLPVSAALVETMRGRLGALPQPPHIVGNVLPPHFVQEMSRSANAPQNVTFLAVGSLLPIKNHASLLKALAEIDGPRLRIAGDGPLRADLEAETHRLGLQNRVSFLGELRQEEVRAEMLSATALIFPSHFETFGVVLIEAMSCGLPVLAIASGGPEEVVTPETGLLVQPGDHDALVEALRYMADAASGFEHKTVRDQVLARFGPEVFCARLRAIYAEALAPKAGNEAA